jgi:hypothetical protein
MVFSAWVFMSLICDYINLKIYQEKLALTAAVKEGWVADDSLLHVTANTLGVSRFQRKISCRKQAAIMTTTKAPQTVIEKQAPG